MSLGLPVFVAEQIAENFARGLKLVASSAAIGSLTIAYIAESMLVPFTFGMVSVTLHLIIES